MSIVVAVRDRLPRIRRQERNTFAPQRVDDVAELVVTDLGERHKIAKDLRPADRMSLGIQIRKRAEQPLDRVAALRIGRGLIDNRIGVARQQARQAARFFKRQRLEDNLAAGWCLGRCGIPHVHEAMLDQRQLVLASADVRISAARRVPGLPLRRKAAPGGGSPATARRDPCAAPGIAFG